MRLCLDSAGGIGPAGANISAAGQPSRRGAGATALVGQYTRQELLVFFPEANQDEVKQMLEGAFAFVRTSWRM